MKFDGSSKFRQDTLQIARYHELMEIAHQGMKATVKNNPTTEQIYKALDSGDSHYNLVQALSVAKEEFDLEGLESFKKELIRMQTCGAEAIIMEGPMTARRCRHTCKGRACKRCAKYQATVRLHYHDTICRIAVMYNYKEADALVAEMKEMLAQKAPWLVVKMTPLDSGNIIIRLSNIRGSESHIFAEDNEVNESLAEFDEIYDMEAVTKISTPDALEVIYRTQSGVEFSSTQLYQARPVGRTGLREKGTRRGYEFNVNSGKIEYMSLKDRKERDKKEAGVIGTFNVEGIPIGNMKRDIMAPYLKDTLKRVTSADGIGVFNIETTDQYMDITKAMAVDLKDSLMRDGVIKLGQTIHENCQITKDNFNEFQAIYATKITRRITPKILATDIDLQPYQDEFERGSMKGALKYIEIQRIEHNKEVIQRGITIDKAVEILLDQMFP